MAAEQFEVYVIDMTTSQVRAGRAGEDEAGVERTTLGQGHPVESMNHVVIKRGKVVDWDRVGGDLDFVISHVLRVEPGEQTFLVAVAPGTSEADRARLATVLFEKVSVPAVSVRSAAELAVYAGGRGEGLAVVADDDLVAVGAVKDGREIPASVMTGDAADASVKALGRLVKRSIDAVEPGLRATLAANIVLSGAIPVDGQELQAELAALLDVRPKVTGGAARTDRVWVGGSVMGSLDGFQDKCVTRAEYDREGAAIINRKR